MAAPSITLFRAMVLPVLVGQLLIEGMATGDLGALLLEFGLSCVSMGESIFILIQELGKH